MSTTETFDPTELEHDVRLKPGVHLVADPADYGNIFYWIYAESDGKPVARLGVITQDEYDRVFEMDPERTV